MPCSFRHRVSRLVLAGATLLMLLTAQARAVEVGAYFYPWYGPYAGGHSLTASLRYNMSPSEPPALGNYNERNLATLDAQIDESHQANIDFWAMSWWGPGDSTDITALDYILANPRANELQYAVHYESTGRLGSTSNPTYSNLASDFTYLAQNYFTNPNYLRIDGRPVVFMYSAGAYFNTPTGYAAVANLRQTMETQFGVDPYLVGDDLGNGGVNTTQAVVWDSITTYNPYGVLRANGGSTQSGVTAVSSLYTNTRATLGSLGVGFIPCVIPGYNDTAVRNGNTPAPRYLTDVAGSAEGSLFTSLLQQAALPNLDPSTNDMLMVTSFNEWHEDTQIEPTIVSPASTTTDGTGTTDGYSFPGYGDTYLNILREETLPEPSGIALLSAGAVCLSAYAWRKRSR